MSIGNLAMKGLKAVATPVGNGLANATKASAKATGNVAWNTTKFGAKQLGKAVKVGFKANPLATVGLGAATVLGAPIIAGGAVLQKALFNDASKKEVKLLEKEVEQQAKQINHLYSELYSSY